MARRSAVSIDFNACAPKAPDATPRNPNTADSKTNRVDEGGIDKPNVCFNDVLYSTNTRFAIRLPLGIKVSVKILSSRFVRP